MYYLRNNSIRVVLGAVGFLGALFASPFLPLIAMILLTLRFRAWEVLLLGLVMDFLWLPGLFLYPVPLFTVGALILLWGLEPLRNELFI